MEEEDAIFMQPMRWKLKENIQTLECDDWQLNLAVTTILIKFLSSFEVAPTDVILQVFSS